MKDASSLIFVPRGGSGEFSELADKIRAYPPVADRTLILPIQHSHVDYCGVRATHIGLEVLARRGHFLPLALVPLEPFVDHPGFTVVFRLAWYGHPDRMGSENAASNGGSPKILQY